MNAADRIPIVLTGTIVPNAVGGPQSDPARRREEYLQSIRFYRQFAPVYFLENSSYPLHDDPEFVPSNDLRIRKFPLSTEPDRGKGFQEFEMLDRWLISEPEPPDRWLKITGRYLVHNVAEILKEFQSEQKARLLIDQVRRFRTARTHLFAVNTSYYRDRLLGLHTQCDDRRERWVEYVLYEALRTDDRQVFRLFATQPKVSGVAGSSGARMGSSAISLALKRVLRRVNRSFDPQYLWYAS